MNKNMLVLAILLAACAGEEVPSRMQADDPQLIPMTFTARVDDGTKTTLGEDYSIRWSQSDQVTLFASTGNAGTTFNVASTESDGLVATFTGLSPETSNGYYYALSPASSEARLVATGGSLSASLPTNQTGVENSYDPAANLSIARVNADAEDSNDILHFKNVGALLSFTV